MTTQGVNVARATYSSAAPAASQNPFAKLAVTLTRWRTRIKQREELAAFNHKLRRDLGLTDADISRELSKPFWRG